MRTHTQSTPLPHSQVKGKEKNSKEKKNPSILETNQVIWN